MDLFSLYLSLFRQLCELNHHRLLRIMFAWLSQVYINSFVVDFFFLSIGRDDLRCFYLQLIYFIAIFLRLSIFKLL